MTLLLNYNCTATNSIKQRLLQSLIQHNNSAFNGKWNYSFESNENELLNRTFELELIVNDNSIKGSYCAVAKGGRKIDCNDKKVFNLTGKIKNNIATVNFFGFYDSKSKGVAKIYFSEGKLIWELVSIEGETAAPKKVEMTKQTNFSELEGNYVLKTCENSRFKINITINKSEGVVFKIYDKNKIISSGKASIDVDKKSISFKDINATFNSNSIDVQNSDNKKIHFTQCREKYLSFIKL